MATRKTEMLHVLLLRLLVTFDVGVNCEPEVKTINLVSFWPVSGNVRPAGRAYVVPAQMAIRDVNARADILPGYDITYVSEDTQCNPGLGSKVFYQALYTPPVKHMILGPMCSDVAETLAQTSHYFNLSHFAFGAATPVLSDRKRYPKFYRISTPETEANVFRIALCKYFGWKKIATISIADGFFSAVADDLVQKLKWSDTKVITQEIYLKDPELRVQNLKNKDARIIISGSYEGPARLILCAAYRLGLYGPKIVWMFPAWYIEHWWRKHPDTVPCTGEEMDIAAEGHFLIGNDHKNYADAAGIAGLKPSTFKEMFHAEPDYAPETRQYEHLSTSAYDVVWGSALALNCTDTLMRERGYNKTLDQFDYSDGDIGDLMTFCITQVNFEGLTGTVKFNERGIRLRNFRIQQIQDTYKTRVGIFRTDGVSADNGTLEWVNGGIRWAGGVPPRDSTQITMVEKAISVSLYVAMSAAATAGNLLAVSLLAFNIRYRNHVYVKLSSPNINNVLIFGCVLSYMSVYLHSYGETSMLLCKLRHFVFTIGFTTAFGAMFSKTWRVYKIFCNKNLQRVKINDAQLMSIVVVMSSVMLLVLIVWEGADPSKINDAQLMAIVVVMSSVMLLVLVVWEVVDPLYIRIVNLQNEIYEIGNDALAIPFLRECTSSHYYYFLWTICIMEGAMLAFGAFLSFETRKIRIEALNDSHQIGLCLYNVIVLSVIVLILSVLLSTQVEIVYGLVSGFILLGTTTTLLVIFIPKVQSVFYPHQITTEAAHNSSLGGVGKRLESRSRVTSLTPQPSTQLTLQSGSADC